MIEQRLPRFLAGLAVVAALSSLSDLSRAGIVLAVAPDLEPGVIACLGRGGNLCTRR